MAVGDSDWIKSSVALTKKKNALADRALAALPRQNREGIAQIFASWMVTSDLEKMVKVLENDEEVPF